MDEKITRLQKQLNTLLSRKRESPERIDVQNEYAWEIALTDTRGSMKLSKEALALSQKLSYERGIAYSYRNLAYGYMVSSELEQAFPHASNALQRFRELQEKEGEATVLDIIAWIYWRLGSFDQALQYAYSCLDLNIQINNKRGEAWAHHNLGAIYADFGEHEQAIREYEEALAMFRDIAYQSAEARILNGLGEVYQKTGELQKALQYHQQGLAISEKFQIHLATAHSLIEIGNIYRDLGKFDTALNHYQKSLGLLEKSKNTENKAFAYLNLGKLYQKQGDMQKGEQCLQEALAIVKKIKVKLTESKVHQALSDLYESSGEVEKALRHYKEFHRLKEEVFNEQSNTALQTMQIRMEVENAEKEAEIHRLKYVELAEMQAQLIQSEKLAFLGNLVAGIAHEVNTPVGVINSNSDVSGRAIKRIEKALQQQPPAAEESFTGALQRSIKILRTNNRATLAAGQKIAKLIDNLKNFARLDEAELQYADIHEGIENTLALITLQLSDRIEVIKAFGDIPEVQGYPQELNQVFMTLLRNAADAIADKGTIKITTAAEDKFVYITISDTGKGIPEKQLNKIFQIGFSNRDNKMRMNVGLANTYNIIKKHDGDITVESEVGKGSEFKIKLPISLA